MNAALDVEQEDTASHLRSELRALPTRRSVTRFRYNDSEHIAPNFRQTSYIHFTALPRRTGPAGRVVKLASHPARRGLHKLTDTVQHPTPNIQHPKTLTSNQHRALQPLTSITTSHCNHRVPAQHTSRHQNIERNFTSHYTSYQRHKDRHRHHVRPH